MAVVADIANAIRDGKLGVVTGALVHRQERLDSEITTRVGRLVAAQRDRMARLRHSVTAANRRSLILTSAFAVSAVIFALLCGFVISWSFILPVREAQAFLRKVAAGNFGERISVPNRDEFGRLGRADEPHERGASTFRHASSATRRAELGRLNLQLAADEQGKVGVSRQHEPRAAHADERHPRLHRNGPRRPLWRGAERAEGAARRHPGQRPASAASDQRCSRPVQDRGRTHGARTAASIRSARSSTSFTSSLRSLAAEKGLDFVVSVPDDLPVAYGDNGRSHAMP